MSRRFMFLGTSSAAIALGTAMHKAMAEGQVVDEITPEPEAPKENPLDSLPASSTDWRVNNEALRPIAANSPLETRQQRRAASKALARGLATAGKLKEREERVRAKKRARAEAAHARHTRISNHVPSTPES